MTELTASIATSPGASRPRLPRTSPATQWLPPVGLIVLSLIPVLAGAVRLTELMGGPEITASNARLARGDYSAAARRSCAPAVAGAA